MLKIVIADDEVHIRELIIQCINCSQTEMEVVGSAENGTEALVLMEKLSPDILITDVCMPGVGGLELIEKVKSDVHYRDLKIIIISGYDDFMYAQKALKLGVSDYMLKPFPPEELLHSLEVIHQEIERKAVVVQNLSTMETQFQNRLLVLQGGMLKRLISGEEDWERLEEQAEQVGMRLNYSQYFVALMKLGSENAGSMLDAREQQALEEILLSVKERYFHESIHSFGVRLEEDVLLLLFCGQGKSLDTLFHRIKEGVKKLDDSLRRHYHVTMNCALGSGCTELGGIRKSYEEARYIMRTNLWEKCSFAEYNVARSMSGVLRTCTGTGNQEEDLLLQIKLANSEAAVIIFRRLLEQYTGMDVSYMEKLDFCLLELLFKIESLLNRAGATEEWSDKTKLHERVRRLLFYGDLFEIRRFMEEMIIEACLRFQELNRNKGEKIVSQMKSLIEFGLSKEDLDLDLIASRLFFSPNYLRRIFKQQEGIGFSDYLIQRRMEAAKKKLRDRTKKIIDISQECGYSNQRYFASAFKKYCGCTPTEYREKMEGY